MSGSETIVDITGTFNLPSKVQAHKGHINLRTYLFLLIKKKIKNLRAESTATGLTPAL